GSLLFGPRRPDGVGQSRGAFVVGLCAGLIARSGSGGGRRIGAVDLGRRSHFVRKSVQFAREVVANVVAKSVDGLSQAIVKGHAFSGTRTAFSTRRAELFRIMEVGGQRSQGSGGLQIQRRQ